MATTQGPELNGGKQMDLGGIVPRKRLRVVVGLNLLTLVRLFSARGCVPMYGDLVALATRKVALAYFSNLICVNLEIV